MTGVMHVVVNLQFIIAADLICPFLWKIMMHLFILILRPLILNKHASMYQIRSGVGPMLLARIGKTPVRFRDIVALPDNDLIPQELAED